jgi:hypothetical protein
MDLGSITSPTETKGKTFVSHVFNFDGDTKDTLLNVTQYTALSVIPIVILNKAVQRVFPEPDEDKTNLEILAEVLGQLVFMLVAVFFVHRLVTFVPTYSGAEYKELNLFSVVLVFLVLMLSVQTRAGQKVNILMDRLIDYYEGNPATKKDAPQPVQQQQQQPIMQQAQQFLPPMPMATNPMAQPPPPSSMMPPPPQQQQQFDNMYERQIEPFGGATGGGLGFSFL